MLCLFIAIQVVGANAQSKLPTLLTYSIEQTSYYTVTKDTSLWDGQKIKNVSARLGTMSLDGKWENYYAFDLNMLNQPVGLTFSPWFSTMSYKEDKDFRYHDSLVLHTQAYEKQYVFGIYTFADGLTPKATKNFSKFIFSAYMEEVDKSYAQDSANFIFITQKDDRTFNRKGWYSSGAAMRYLKKDNPFFRSGGEVFFGYFLDALSVLVTVGSTYAAYNGGAKLVPLIAVGVAFGTRLISKVFFNYLTRDDFRICDAVYSSKYRIPRNVVF